MTQFHATPYDISAEGFFFKTAEEFATKAAAHRNAHGDPVEEYELRFIDGEAIDAALVDAIGLYQSNVGQIIDAIDTWEDYQKHRVIIAVGECGYAFDDSTDPDSFDVELYECDTLRELAEQFVEEGLYGPIPDALVSYIDYDAIARDLAVDCAEITIDGTRLIYRWA